MGYPKSPGDPEAHRALAARHLEVIQDRNAAIQLLTSWHQANDVECYCGTDTLESCLPCKTEVFLSAHVPVVKIERPWLSSSAARQEGPDANPS